MKPTLRAGLMLTLALLASLVAFDPAAGQGPGGFRGGRPGMPGSNIGRPPGLPGGGVIGGPGMGAIGGGPGVGGGFGGSVTVWQCPNCKREVGRGPLPPAAVTCCGQTYINGRSTGGGAFINIPPMSPPPPTQPPVTQPPVVQPPTQPPPAEMNQPAMPAPVEAPPAASDGSAKFILLGVGVIVVGLAILGGVAILVVQSQRGSSMPRRRRYRD
jgi:hypothetical protein